MKKMSAMAISIVLAGTMFIGCGKTNESSKQESKAENVSTVLSVTDNSSEIEENDDSIYDENDSEYDEKDTETENVELTSYDFNSAFENADEISESDIIGNWEAKLCCLNGEVSDRGLGIPLKMMFHLEFKDDHTLVLTKNISDEKKSSDTFDWKIENNRIITSLFENEIVVNNGNMFVHEENEKDGNMYVEFEKTEEFSEFEKIEESDIIGKWELDKVFAGDEKAEKEKDGVPLGALSTIEINEDHTGTMYVSFDFKNKQDKNLTWTIENNKIIMKFDGEETDNTLYLYKGNLILISDDYLILMVTMEFTKVDEFTDYDYDEIIKKYESENKEDDTDFNN